MNSFSLARVFPQVVLTSFPQHPFQTLLGQSALLIGIAATNIGVITGKPTLLQILLRAGHDFYTVTAEFGAPFVQGKGVPDCSDMPHRGRVGEGLGIVGPAERRNRVPNAHEMHGAFH